MTETMEQYMSKTQENYGSGVTRPMINQDTPFELKGQFFKELRDNTFSGSEHEDANEHIEKMTKEPAIRISPPARTAKKMEEINNFQQEPDESLFRAWEIFKELTRSTETSNRLAAIQAELNNLGREIKKVNKKVYAAQVRCELCKGPHNTKDCPQKEEGKTLEEAYYTQFGSPYQPGGQYRAAGLGFYQENNGNSSYLDQKPSLEESLTKFMAESIKRHEEN
ncbi:hypothetical protein Tco_0109386 [Tanacetum coccineum]